MIFISIIRKQCSLVQQDEATVLITNLKISSLPIFCCYPVAMALSTSRKWANSNFVSGINQTTLSLRCLSEGLIISTRELSWHDDFILSTYSLYSIMINYLLTSLENEIWRGHEIISLLSLFLMSTTMLTNGKHLINYLEV